MHPTVKPVALVAEAIKDCSRRGEIVLDPFGGSGTTLVAAHKTGRLARLIELDPAYCDTILHRFERVTGKQATHAASGMSSLNPPNPSVETGSSQPRDFLGIGGK
jgi:DNA modification methylase